MYKRQHQAIKAAGGKGIPTLKPCDINTLKEKFALVKDSGAFAAAMDIDAAGLPFLKNQTPPAGSKSVEELKEVVQAAGVPFILKGIMTVKGALKAKEAGADVYKRQEYASLKEKVTAEEVMAIYQKYYGNEYFIRLLGAGACPETKWVEGSNFVDIGFQIDERTNRIVMMGAIDNLVKGAAGQAVQNMNLMFGLPEQEGLKDVYKRQASGFACGRRAAVGSSCACCAACAGKSRRYGCRIDGKRSLPSDG